MMFTPFMGLIGGGVTTLTTSAGGTAVAMGAMGMGLLAVTTLVLVLAHRWSRS